MEQLSLWECDSRAVRAASREAVRLEYDTRQVNCETTKEMPLLEEIVGQERALKTLRFSLASRNAGSTYMWRVSQLRKKVHQL